MSRRGAGGLGWLLGAILLAAAGARGAGRLRAAPAAAGGLPGVADPGAFYLARLARFRSMADGAARDGDRARARLMSHLTLSAYRACCAHGRRGEADAMLDRAAAPR